MKWAIASSIKTVEIVQAILNMQYWAPMTQRQSDDPSWLRLSHAVQLAKEIGLDKPTTIAEQVSFLCPNGTAKQKACLTQNFERTWYHCFISDKSFGIISGKSSLVSWSQIPKSVSDWWQKAMASPHDRVVSGVVEMRQLLVKLLQQGKRKDKAPSCILKWYSQALIDMEQVLSLRCAPDEKPSSLYLPILAFYIDHSALILGAQALRELATLESADTTDEVITISRKNANVASRLLDHVIYDRVFQDCKVGYHNNQFLMMCHASTEILNAINRGALDPGEIEQAAERSFTVAKRMEEISRYIPATSAVHLYFDISHFLSREIRKASDIGKSTLEKTDSTSSCATGEWLKLIDENTIDLSNWLDEGLFGSDPMLDAETRNFIEDGTIADV
ncbi:hypothetical protein N7456_011342 [Penicillium angulare]|uniref:Uncharacterized protein n=1 Tax=Penicillium angulare TaxID=116970 RepID=A0A9W9ETM4_9EURO|nr:hypothetical protein N7456_011342 [Penicillium angulare]